MLTSQLLVCRGNQADMLLIYHQAWPHQEGEQHLPHSPLVCMAGMGFDITHATPYIAGAAEGVVKAVPYIHRLSICCETTIADMY